MYILKMENANHIYYFFNIYRTLTYSVHNYARHWSVFYIGKIWTPYLLLNELYVKIKTKMLVSYKILW